jgi:DNA-binding transcriptional LysR family regulator
MDRIDSMGVFARVVEKQSFSGAARELCLSQAAVSKHVRALEDWLGARLLDRTTRRLNVTESGALVYEGCERILDEIDEVQQSTSALQTAPRGVLHLAAPVSFGTTQLGPALADYLARYPEVVVDATLDDRFVDLVQEGFDLALRVGALKDSSLIARRLAPVRFALCAAPGYVKQYGEPRQPDDLVNHRCLFYSLRTIPGEWCFVGPEGESRFAYRRALSLQQRQHAAWGNACGRRYWVGSDVRSRQGSCRRSPGLADARLSTGRERAISDLSAGEESLRQGPKPDRFSRGPLRARAAVGSMAPD